MPAFHTVALGVLKSGSREVLSIAHQLRSHGQLMHSSSRSRHNISSWTFVRDPLARFLSAYAELEARLVYPYGVCEEALKTSVRSELLSRTEPIDDNTELGKVGGNLSKLPWPVTHVWYGAKWYLANCRQENAALLARGGTKIFYAHPFGTVERVRGFAQQALSGELDNYNYARSGGLRDIEHVFSQCQALCALRSFLAHRFGNASSSLGSYLGQLEHFDTDLARLFDTLTFSPSDDNAVARAKTNATMSAPGLHELFAMVQRARERNTYASATSRRHQAAMEAARYAFGSDAMTRKLVCRIVDIDYACLNPLLPPGRRYVRVCG